MSYCLLPPLNFFQAESQVRLRKDESDFKNRVQKLSNYNCVVDRRNMPVEDLIRSQLLSEEEFTDQRSSHFKLCIAVNFKSL